MIADPAVAVRADAALAALLVLVTPFVISHRLVRRAAANLESILGALSIICSWECSLRSSTRCSSGRNAPVFLQRADAFPVDFLYFSFVTITTVGYGDLTPVQDIARMLAVTEALIGQFYLVTVIAILVSRATIRRRSWNHPITRRHPLARAAHTPSLQSPGDRGRSPRCPGRGRGRAVWNRLLSLVAKRKRVHWERPDRGAMQV